MSRKAASLISLSVAIATSGPLFWLRAPLAVAATPPGSGSRPVLLQLPANVTIWTTGGQTHTPRRLLSVSPAGITYDQAGQRFLAASKVKSIAFSGQVLLQSNGTGPIRGVEPKGCPKTTTELLVATAAVAIQPGGRSISLLPERLTKTRYKDLSDTSVRRTLVVNELRFDPGGKVRLLVKACAPLV